MRPSILALIGACLGGACSNQPLPTLTCTPGGGGVFGAAIAVQTGLVTNSEADLLHPMAVGDLNNDGNLDIVTADQGSGDVVVLFGNGDGTFQTAVHSQVPALTDGGIGFAFGELRVAAMGSPSEPSVAMWDDETASVLVESVQPTGELNLVAVLDAGRSGVAATGLIQVADFNRDGIADCAVEWTNISDGQGGFTVFLGNDAGQYSSASSPIRPWCNPDCAGDFNEDGILDLFAETPAGPPWALSVYLGQGNGAFSSTPLSSGLNANAVFSMLIADLDEDGHLDLLSFEGQNNSYALLLGRGDGTFTTGSTPTLTPSLPQALRDLNNDGHLDYVGIDQMSSNVVVALGNGDGSFQPTARVGSAYFLAFIIVGDVNNDGRPDLIMSNADDANVTVFLNNCH